MAPGNQLTVQKYMQKLENLKLSRGQDIGAYIQHSATKLPPQHISGFYWIGNTGLAIINAECGKLFTCLEFKKRKYRT
jgi:hypothetical protein